MQVHSQVAGTAVAITPDNNVKTLNLVGLYVGGTGDVAIETPAGDQVTFKAAPVGCILPVLARAVLSTGTTATNIVGFKA
jgi:hypothetical protein